MATTTTTTAVTTASGAVATATAADRRATRTSRLAEPPVAVQRSFDDLGTPLHEVTFCVIDLETTGGSPQTCGITEIGAVKVRGGECLGTFQTLVNPGAAIPPEITVLTGITQAMVLPAPRIETVLPTLLEFVGDAVIVGHNVRFDLGFLRAALERSGRPPLPTRAVDTCALARRLVRDEVPNCRLGTLAERLRLDHRPSHRALDDALATADLLHLLLERAAGLGVLGLDDLVALPTMAGHAQAAKLRLTADLPRRPGVYLFRDRGGRVLYVGKATNLRSRVRSYFSGDERRKIGSLLRETAGIDHEVCAHPLEAAVREVRLIHEHRPRYNRQSRDWDRYVYLKLTLGEPFPRLSVVRVVRDDGARYLGPLSSTRLAKRVAEAIETAVPLRRCTGTPGRSPRSGPCAPAQLGVATCPCVGTVTQTEYAAIVEHAVLGMTRRPDLLLGPLTERMAALATDDRFEEAADVRDRASALTAALTRQRRLDGVRAAGTVVVELADGSGAEIDGGLLVRAWPPATSVDSHAVALALGGDAPHSADDDATTPAADHAISPVDPSLAASLGPLAREHADEVAAVARWLHDQAHRVRLVYADGGLSSPLPAMPSFEPRGRGLQARR